MIPDRSLRVALTGWFGSDNLGDELILQSLITSLRVRDIQPVVISIQQRHRQISKDVPTVVHRSFTDHRKLVRVLRAVDAMIIAGGVVQNETSPWNIPFHASRLWAANMARCPFSAIGMGAGLIRGNISRSIMRRALQPADMLVVRDANSARLLQQWDLQNVKIGADPVFGLKTETTTTSDTMCVILRRPNHRGLKTAAAKSRVSLPEEMLDRWSKAIDRAASITGLTPKFVAFQASRDHILHHHVADRLNVSARLAKPTLDTVLHEVASSRLVVTMRYHGAVAALLHNRPSILLGYSPKMASLAAEGRGWAPVLSPRHITVEQITAAVTEAFSSAARMPETLARLRTRLTENDVALDALVADL